MAELQRRWWNCWLSHRWEAWSAPSLVATEWSDSDVEGLKDYTTTQWRQIRRCVACGKVLHRRVK
jgi:hypothetical protein